MANISGRRCWRCTVQVAAGKPPASRAPPVTPLPKSPCRAARTVLAGKPEKLIEKVVSGRMNKFLAEVCLLDQLYFNGDAERSVREELQVQGAGNESFSVTAFARAQVGQ
jgi:elongation factor Ts